MNKLFKKTAAFLLVTAMLCGCSGENDPAENTAQQENTSAAANSKPAEFKPITVTGKINENNICSLYDNETLYSEGVYMVNLDTGITVVSKNPDKRLIPASLTKIMTALVCLENVSDLSLPVECPQVCFDEFEGDDPNFEGASGAALEPEQKGLTYLDCLYGLMLPSGCEAANVIAYNVGGGDMKAFIKMMNETAVRIGCKNTNFTNAHGLYETENYSSARDMYIITRYAMDNCPMFTEISCSQEYNMPPNEKNPDGYKITHTNRMFDPSNEYFYEGVKGIKTGSINEYFSFNSETREWDKVETRGARGLVALFEKGGMRYLLSTVAAPFYNEDGSVPETQFPFLDHKALFDRAAGEFSFGKLISKGEKILSLNVNGGKDSTVGIVTDDDFFTLIPLSLDKEQVIFYSYPFDTGALEAPIEKGTKVGELVIKIGDETAAVIPLVTAKKVAAKKADAA